MGMNWVHLAHDKGQVTGCGECGNILSGSVKCIEFLDWTSSC